MNMNLKKVVSSIAALALSASCFTAFASNFSDVADTAAYKTAIDELVALKIVNGYEDGTFLPDKEITRAEVTKMVVAAMGPSYTSAAESAAAASDFTDVAGHWAAGYINVGVAQSFINGMGDGTFSPDTNVTYSQIVKMLVAALGYTTAAEAAGGYPNGYLQIGSSTGVTAGVTGLSADTAVTRAQVAQLIDNALKTPIVAVTSWTTDIYGKPVAVTEIMDGRADDIDYKSLLTEYHNAYVVKGRVTGTHTTESSIDADKVQFQVEYADNFDDQKIAYKKSGKASAGYDTDNVVTEDMYFGDIAAASYLFTYATAIVQKDDNDDYTMISITPYGTNDIVELKSDDYDSFTDGDDTNDVISFTIGTSTKTKDYKLAYDAGDNYEVYVNGVKASSAATAITDYVDGNKIGTVTLIDTPSEGSTSKDGKYDYIMITYQTWAIVDNVTTSTSTNKIYFDEFQTGNGMKSSLTMDLEDEDKTYTFTKDGAEATIDDVKENSILLLTYDVTAILNDSDFVNIDICDKTVEGKVTSLSSDDNEYTYTVDGTEYTYVQDTYPTTSTSTSALKTGNEYTLYLDAAGRIVKMEELASSKNYGVIDRVYKNNDGDLAVRIIKADGTRSAYVAKDDADATTAAGIAYGSESALDSSTLVNIDKRVVTYKINSSSEIYSFTAVETAIVTEKEYKESTTKVGSASMSESTAIVDLSKIVNVSKDGSAITAKSSYTASDIKNASLSTFVDGNDYSVIYAKGTDDIASDNTTRFVIITKNGEAIATDAAFAIVDSVSTSTREEDGTEYKTIKLYNAKDGNDELQTIYVSDDAKNGNDVAVTDSQIEALSRGDVITYSLDGDGMISNVAILFTAASANSSADGLTYDKAFAVYGDDKYKNDTANKSINTEMDKFALTSPIDSWNNSDSNTTTGYARIGFGLITDKTTKSMTLAKLNKAAADMTTLAKSGELYSSNSDCIDLTYDSDVNVYVYDYNNQNKSTSERISIGATGSVVKTTLASSVIVKDSERDDFYNWTAIQKDDSGVVYGNYAFVKVLDGDVTDVLIIVPKD